MKIIYKAEDGTEFDKESNCKKYEVDCAETREQNKERDRQIDALIELAENVTHTWEDISIDSRAGANFIIDNIHEINEILRYNVDCANEEIEIVYKDCEGEYRAVHDDGYSDCKGCAFVDKPCRDVIDFYSCGQNNILWIKK